MTLGTLREQLCYPQHPDPALFSDHHLRSMLELVNLGALVQRYPDFNVKQDWPRLLSLEEQQRLAFARLLLNSPRYVVLDEATSAVDVKTERQLYNLLAERNIAFISVDHRSTLTAFHDNVLELDGSGAWRLLPASGYSRTRPDLQIVSRAPRWRNRRRLLGALRPCFRGRVGGQGPGVFCRRCWWR